jgi:hypothetical protein
MFVSAIFVNEEEVMETLLFNFGESVLITGMVSTVKKL